MTTLFHYIETSPSNRVTLRSVRIISTAQDVAEGLDINAKGGK